jgi:hypothetical protein
MDWLTLRFIDEDDKVLEEEFTEHLWLSGLGMLRLIINFHVLLFLIGYLTLLIFYGDPDVFFVLIIGSHCIILTLFQVFDSDLSIKSNFRFFFIVTEWFTNFIASGMVLYTLFLVDCGEDKLLKIIENKNFCVDNNNAGANCEISDGMDRTAAICIGRKYGTGYVDLHLADVTIILSQPIMALPWRILVFPRIIHCLVTTFAIYFETMESGAPLEMAFIHLATCALSIFVIMLAEIQWRSQFRIEKKNQIKHETERKDFERQEQEARDRVAKILAKSDQSIQNYMRLYLPNLTFVSGSQVAMLVKARAALVDMKLLDETDLQEFATMELDSLDSFQFIEAIMFEYTSKPRFKIEFSPSQRSEPLLRQQPPANVIENQQDPKKSEQDLETEFRDFGILDLGGDHFSETETFTSPVHGDEDVEEEKEDTKTPCIAKFFDIEAVTRSADEDFLWDEQKCCTEFMIRLSQACGATSKFG